MAANLWWENEEGVHYIGPWDDFMLCGDASDGSSTRGSMDFGEMWPTKKRVVTCPRCVAMIKHIRGKRIRTAHALKLTERRRLLEKE